LEESVRDLTLMILTLFHRNSTYKGNWRIVEYKWYLIENDAKLLPITLCLKRWKI
jgi:hypothetical protein